MVPPPLSPIATALPVLSTVYLSPFAHYSRTKDASVSQIETNVGASGHIHSHASQPGNEMLDLWI